MFHICKHRVDQKVIAIFLGSSHIVRLAVMTTEERFVSLRLFVYLLSKQNSPLRYQLREEQETHERYDMPQLLSAFPPQLSSLPTKKRQTQTQYICLSLSHRGAPTTKTHLLRSILPVNTHAKTLFCGWMNIFYLIPSQRSASLTPHLSQWGSCPCLR